MILFLTCLRVPCVFVCCAKKRNSSQPPQLGSQFFTTFFAHSHFFTWHNPQFSNTQDCLSLRSRLARIAFLLCSSRLPSPILCVRYRRALRPLRDRCLGRPRLRPTTCLALMLLVLDDSAVDPSSGSLRPVSVRHLILVRQALPSLAFS